MFSNDQNYTIFDGQVQGIPIKVKVKKSQNMIIIKSNAQKFKLKEPELQSKNVEEIQKALRPILIDLKIVNGIIEPPILKHDKTSKILWSSDKIKVSLHNNL